MELWIFNHSRPFNQFQIHISGPIYGAIHRNGTHGHFASSQSVSEQTRGKSGRKYCMLVGWSVGLFSNRRTVHAMSKVTEFVLMSILFRHNSVHFFLVFTRMNGHMRARVDLLLRPQAFLTHSHTHSLSATVEKPDSCTHSILMSANEIWQKAISHAEYEGCKER